METDDDILSQLLHSFTKERIPLQTNKRSQKEEDYTAHHSFKKQYSIVAGLAAAMVPSLAIASPNSPPLVNAALSCVGPRKMQSQLTPPTLLDYTLSTNNNKRRTESMRQYSTSAIKYVNRGGSNDPEVSIQGNVITILSMIIILFVDIPITESDATEVFNYEDDINCCGVGLTRCRIIG